MTPEQHLFILLAALSYQRAFIPIDGAPAPIDIKIPTKELAYVIANYEFQVGKVEGELDWTLSLKPLETAIPFKEWDKLVEEAREAGLGSGIMAPSVTKVIQ